MGHQTGMRTALVLGGVTQREDLVHAIIQPDYVLDNIIRYTPDRMKNVSGNFPGKDKWLADWEPVTTECIFSLNKHS